jgi:hypothetical protein
MESDVRRGDLVGTMYGVVDSDEDDLERPIGAGSMVLSSI